MLIFLDTEFTDLIDIELISIGLVSEDGHEFYAERNDFDETKCSDFVRAAILPTLGVDPSSVVSRKELKQRLLEWLTNLRGIENLIIGFDYFADWELFCDVIDCELPIWLSPLPIGPEIDQLRRENYFKLDGVVRHHALHDARANRYSYSIVS